VQDLTDGVRLRLELTL